MTTEPSLISEREREILRLVAMGATNQQIAGQLNISVNTVKVHLRNIFGKIGAASRTEATVYAIQQGLVNIDRPQNSPDVRSPAQAPFATVSPDMALSIETLLESAPVEVAPLPEPQAEPVVALDRSVEPLAEAGASVLGPTPRPIVTRRRGVLLAIFTATALIAAAVLLVYPLLQQQAPPTEATATSAVPQPNRWKTRTQLATPRANFGAVTYDGKLYVVAGSAANGPSAVIERYDPASSIWVSLDEKPTPASYVQAAIVRGLIYVPGGEGPDGKPLTAVEAYDPRLQRWEKLAPLPEPRSRYALASVEGRLYLFGGWDGEQYRAEVFLYDPDSKQWSTGAPLPTPRRGAGAVAIEGRIYVIGGENEAGALRVNERYDPNGGQGGQWSSVAPLQFASGTPAVSGVANNILVFDPQMRTGLQYNTMADAWAPIAVPDTVSTSSRAASYNNTSVFLFGQVADGAPVTVSEYQALNNLFLPNIGANS